MADESVLGLLGSNDLAGFNQSVVQSDPYGIAGRSLGAWQPDMSTWSPTEVGVTSFAKSFLSGLLGNYAQQNAANQLNSVISVLPQLREDPLHVATPEGVDAAPFSALRANQALKYYAAKDAAAEEKNKTLSTLFGNVLGKYAEKDPTGALKIATSENPQEALKEIMSGGTGYDPKSDPDSPAFKMKEAIQKEEDAARGEILKLPAIQQFNTTQTTLSRIKDLKDDDTGTSDIPFITLFLSGLDGSVVKEGEYNRVSGSNPLIEKYKNLFESTLNGGSAIGTETKKQMYNELLKTQKGLLAEAILQSAPRIATAAQRGANPKNILPFDPDMKFETPSSSAVLGGASQSQVQNIIAQAKAKYGDTLKGRQEAQKAIQMLGTVNNTGRIPLG